MPALSRQGIDKHTIEFNVASSLLSATGLRKSFSNNPVLKDVDLSVAPGEIHALVGENGAGKSTLIKILAGVHKADAGEIKLAGRKLVLKTPQDAIANGIVVIHQELSLAPHLSAEENIFLGHFPRTGFGTLDRTAMRTTTRQLLERLKIEIDPTIPVARLSIAQQQMIEIAKAISFNARLLVLDEPTAVLDSGRVDTLFELIGRLRAEGIGIIFISHHLDEVFRISDRVSVLRDGQLTGVADITSINKDWLISKMIGRKFERHDAQARATGEAAVELMALSAPGAFEDVTFSVARGEIVALAGLIGAGRSEVGEAIYGLRKPNAGALRIFGKDVRRSNPRYAAAKGVAYVSEDRKALGLLANRPVRENATIAALARFCRLGFVGTAKEKAFVGSSISELDIRLASMEANIATLSGGNQQKVMLARALATKPKILVFDEPTRGVDIGAKREIYRFIEMLASEGVAIVMISSELEEVLRLADQVVVMRQGRVTATLPKSEASEETIMRAASIGA